MGRITINLAGTGLLPIGDHAVEVQRVDVREKNDGSNDYLHIDLTVIGRKYDGRSLSPIASLHPDYLHLTADLLVALGVDVDAVDFKWTDDTERVLISPDLVGKRAIAPVTHEEVGSQSLSPRRTGEPTRSWTSRPASGSPRPARAFWTGRASRSGPSRSTGRSSASRRPRT